uniref:Integrase core domain containing protein n=1 Tax=Solanum tuberosum TaxID=4113 RepID=M1DBP7_SOLTU
MVSQWIAKMVGVPDLTRRLAQLKFNSEPVKLGELKYQFGDLDSDHPLDPQQTNDPIKNGGASDHSVYRQVDRTRLFLAIKEDAVTSKRKALKLPTTIRKGKGNRPTPARKTITRDPNTPPWARGFCRAVHVFLADSQSIDLGKASIVVPSGVTPGTEAQTDGETA